jgi:hypothetical protein
MQIMRNFVWCFIAAALAIVTSAEGALVAHFTLDEANGGTVESLVGDWTGTLAGGTMLPQWQWSDLPEVPSGTASALFFDASMEGVDPYVATDYPGIAGGAPRTISAWVKLEPELPNFAVIVGYGLNATGNRFSFRINNSEANGTVGGLRLEVQGAFATATTDLRDGLWHHVAVVHLAEGNGPHDALIYVDGQVEALSAQSAGNEVINTLTDLPVYIGNSPHSLGAYGFNGAIDDVRIYDEALDVTAIQGIAANPPASAVVINDGPKNQSAILGDTAVFSVTAGGTMPKTYQWKLDGVDIADATGPVLAVPNAGTGASGPYSVVVDNGVGSATSGDAFISYTLPTIQPGNLTVLSTNSATFEMLLPEGLEYTYQWKRDGTDIPGADGSILELTNLTTAEAGAYTVAVGLGDNLVVSDPVELIVAPIPTMAYGETVLADSPVGYWRLGEETGSSMAVDEVGINDGAYLLDVILEQEGALLDDPNTAALFPGTSIDSKVDIFYASELNPEVFTIELWAMVTGGSGTTRSPLTSRDSFEGSIRGYAIWAASNDRWQFKTADGGSAWNTIEGPAVVENEWVHLVGLYDGSDMKFYVNGALVGALTAPFQFQDYEANPTRIGAGATESIDGGEFFVGKIDEVAIYNRALSGMEIVSHYAAAFPLNTPPQIDVQPAGATVLAGIDVSLGIQVTSATPATIQWRKDGEDIEGATETTLVISGITAGEAGSYDAVVTNNGGTVTSDAAVINVLDGVAGTNLSVNILGYEGVNNIGANGGEAGIRPSTGWNEVGYNQTNGAAGSLVDNRGAMTGVAISWTSATNRRWNGTFGEPAADYALLNGFLEANSSSAVTIEITGIPPAYQANGYDLIVYMGAPSGAAGSVGETTWYGAISDGVTTYYYKSIDLALWDGVYVLADSTVPEEAPLANYAVFSGLHSGAITLTGAKHPNLSGPGSISAFELIPGDTPSFSILEISTQAGQIVLEWTGDFVLQTSPNANGPWTDVPDATSPYQTDASASQLFFSLRTP